MYKLYTVSMLTFRRFHECNDFLPVGVQGIWSIDNAHTDVQIDVIPDGHPEIVIPIRGQVSYEIGSTLFRATEPLVIGQIFSPARFWVGKNASIVCLKLYPHTLGHLVKNQSKDITNSCEFVKTCSDELALKLNAFYTHLNQENDVLLSLKALLISLAGSFNHELNPLLASDQKTKWHMVRHFTFDLKYRKTKYSSRYLEKLYACEIGLSPKQYLKVLRIKKASLLMAENDSRQIMDVAQTLGYYDLSHFYKDFKSLSFKSPRQFFQNQSAFHKNKSYIKQYDYS